MCTPGSTSNVTELLFTRARNVAFVAPLWKRFQTVHDNNTPLVTRLSGRINLSLLMLYTTNRFLTTSRPNISHSQRCLTYCRTDN
jgi:hypothetical protein